MYLGCLKQKKNLITLTYRVCFSGNQQGKEQMLSLETASCVDDLRDYIKSSGTDLGQVNQNEVSSVCFRLHFGSRKFLKDTPTQRLSKDTPTYL
jgi:hypothetical protein